MPIANNSKEAQEIRKLIPLATIPLSRFESICAKINILTAAPGETLFKKGDQDKELVYLLSGTVSLQAAGMQVEVIDAESYSGRFALAHHNPRKINAVALNSLRYLRLDTDWLIPHLTPINQEEDIDMIDTESAENPEDWMTTLLNSPVFKNLPPANLQKLLMSLEEVRVVKGTVVLKQGDIGEYYYLIKYGHCILSRKPSPNARDIKLAQLRSSDTFGEDSLLSDLPISVTITALTDLILLRLNKEKFINLIKIPALKYVSASELASEVSAGAYILDVRAQDEFTAGHLQDSINAPFFSLLMQLKVFERKRPVIVVCNDGKASTAAAFLLLRNKFNAKVLTGGLASLPENLSEGISFVHNSTVRQTFTEDSVPEIAVETNVAPVEEARNITLEQIMQENKNLKVMVLRLKQQCVILQQEKETAESLYQELLNKTQGSMPD